jgi:SAM-dependent methyltransferase
MTHTPFNGDLIGTVLNANALQSAQMNYIAKHKESRGRGKSNETSAQILVPLLYKLFKPVSVLDVGCGGGAWCREFINAGVTKVYGIDKRDCSFTHEKFLFQRNVDSLLNIAFPHASLTLCLEVAEHLPEEEADGLVGSLVMSAPVIIFAAGIPGQGGQGHINEQWPTYWFKKFVKHGYVVRDCIRPIIWNDKEISFWYRQDILVFCTQEAAEDFHPLNPYCALDLVHPEAWLNIGPMGLFQRISKALPVYPAALALFITMVVATIATMIGLALGV